MRLVLIGILLFLTANPALAQGGRVKAVLGLDAGVVSVIEQYAAAYGMPLE